MISSRANLVIVDENGLHWAAEVDTVFHLKQKQLPTPTFSSGFVSLRHTLVMNLKLVNQRGRAVTQSLCLRNPLQITYASKAPKAHLDRMHDTLGMNQFDNVQNLYVRMLRYLFVLIS